MLSAVMFACPGASGARGNIATNLQGFTNRRPILEACRFLRLSPCVDALPDGPLLGNADTAAS